MCPGGPPLGPLTWIFLRYTGNFLDFFGISLWVSSGNPGILEFLDLLGNPRESVGSRRWGWVSTGTWIADLRDGYVTDLRDFGGAPVFWEFLCL